MIGRSYHWTQMENHCPLLWLTCSKQWGVSMCEWFSWRFCLLQHLPLSIRSILVLGAPGNTDALSGPLRCPIAGFECIHYLSSTTTERERVYLSEVVLGDKKKNSLPFKPIALTREEETRAEDPSSYTCGELESAINTLLQSQTGKTLKSANRDPMHLFLSCFIQTRRTNIVTYRVACTWL